MLRRIKTSVVTFKKVNWQQQRSTQIHFPIPFAHQNVPIFKTSATNCNRAFTCSVKQATNFGTEFGYTTEQRGSLYDDNYRMYLKNSDGDIISPFHDVPLRAGGDIYNMVVEVPRWSNAKMEISKDEKMNPIKQDKKNGELRFVANCFPHTGYPWNYGALPQTWEDPNHLDPLTGAKGDSDPIDICEIGSQIHNTGSIVQVKLLGILALIDEGETDWKIIGIDVKDPNAGHLNNIGDVEKIMPGLLKATVRWYKIYKTPFGNPPNKFAFNGEIQGVEFTHRVVADVHTTWKTLMLGKMNSHSYIDRSCTMFKGPHTIHPYDAQCALEAKSVKGDPKKYDMVVNKWHYIKDTNM